jgi:hypothetical protein
MSILITSIQHRIEHPNQTISQERNTQRYPNPKEKSKTVAMNFHIYDLTYV